MEIALDPLVNRTGDVWHACVASLRDVATLCYGWRADADISWDAGNRFHPGALCESSHADGHPTSDSWCSAEVTGLYLCALCELWGIVGIARTVPVLPTRFSWS